MFLDTLIYNITSHDQESHWIVPIPRLHVTSRTELLATFGLHSLIWDVLGIPPPEIWNYVIIASTAELEYTITKYIIIACPEFLSGCTDARMWPWHASPPPPHSPKEKSCMKPLFGKSPWTLYFKGTSLVYTKTTIFGIATTEVKCIGYKAFFNGFHPLL